MLILIKENKRHLLRMSVALCIAFSVNQWYSFSSQWWLPLATFFVMLTDVGSAVYQGILRYLLLLLAAGAVSWVFSLTEFVYVRAYDITVGAAIGIIVNITLFPDPVDKYFRQSTAMILQCYNFYFQDIVKLLLRKDSTSINKAKISVEQALLKLPLWVYETGFDLTLQKSYQYFVMKVSELGELLFSMHHLARYDFSKPFRQIIAEPLQQSVEKSNAFFTALIHILHLKQLEMTVMDFYQEIEIMEQNFKKSIIIPAEILDVSKDSVYLIEFIYNMRELQDILVKMSQALTESQKLL
jgi:hypothetical protein